MLVAWRHVHHCKGMRGGRTDREESRDAGARGTDMGLGRHIIRCGCAKNKEEDGDIRIEDWPLPETPLIESWGVSGACI